MTAAAVTGMTGPRRVAVIGGGISGLAAAHRVLTAHQSATVVLYEASRRLGGIIRTEEAEGFLMELGPDSFITNKPAGVELCRELDYLPQLIDTDARYRRSLVLSRGRPLPVPDGFMLMAPEKPLSLLTSPVLSLAGRLRLLAEYFIPGRPVDGDESLADFVRRRFGVEALERLVQPLIGGIYTSDPEKLSLRATLPRFPEMEKAYGSVIRGVLAQRKATPKRGAGASGESSGSGARYGLFTAPAKGLGDLIGTLERYLRSSVGMEFRLGTPVLEVVPCDVSAAASSGAVAGAAAVAGPAGAGWQVRTGEGVDHFDAVIMTLPAWASAGLLRDARLQGLRSGLCSIPYAGSALIVSGHQLKDFSHPMDAFGLVIPAVERRRILAVSFSSRKFLNRAPAGQLVLRTFVGGAMQPELLELDDAALLRAVHEELTAIFGMRREALFAEVVRYPRAMPQYEVGHAERVAAIERELQCWRGLCLAGSGYYGVGIPDSIASGRRAADQCFES
jgi:oxygen-dependent protoporphyrinogen oxidase